MKRLSLYLFFYFISNILTAQSTIVDVSQIDSNGIDVIGKIKYYETSVANLDRLLQIPSLPDSFHVLSANMIFPHRKGWHRWYKLEFENSSNSIHKVILWHRKLQRTTLFQKKHGNWQEEGISYTDKDRNSWGLIKDYLEIKVKPCSHEVIYFRFDYNKYAFHGVIYPLAIGLKKIIKSLEDDVIYSLFKSAFLGIVGMFALFTFFQYFQNRDPSYLWYSLYLLTILFMYFWFHGRYFFTPFTPYISKHLDLIFYVTHYPLILVYIFFLRSFLNVKNQQEQRLGEVLLRMIPIVSLFFVIAILLFFTAERGISDIFINLTAVGMMFLYAYLLYQIFFCLPFSSVRYVGIGTLFLFIIIIMERWQYWGQLFTEKEQYLKFWSFYIKETPTAFLLEIICFGLALGHRTKMLQQEKQQAIQEKEVEAARTRLFTNITHEFRTPLTVIKGEANQILKNSKYDLARRIECIHFYSDTLTSLVDDLLDLSKLEAGKVQLVNYQGDLVRYLKYLGESLASYASDNKIRMSFHSTLPHWIVDFSPLAIQQIISNLVSNALKFTPEYGQVKVELQNVSNQIVIKVTDTGEGMQAEELANVFEPFFQTSSNTQSSVKGTGLGLAIVKQLVELLNGEIVVSSEWKKGTTFTLTLPVTNIAPPLDESDLSTTKRLLIRKSEILAPAPTLGILPKILIVEDNTDVQNYLIDLLRGQFTILNATNGQVGLEMALQEQPDFIIADEMMPHKSGFAMLKELKASPATQRIPVIMITAKADQIYRLKGLSLQADAYLAKPFVEEELRLILRNLQLKRTMETQAEELVRWQGKVVTEPAKKAVLILLADCYTDKTFNATRLKIALQRQGYGGEKAVAQLLKMHFATTPGKLLLTYRLEKARALLREYLAFSIPEIIAVVGLSSDQTSFTKIYKKQFGITPAAERK